MPSSPLATGANLRPDDNWGPPDDQSMGPGGNAGTNGVSLPTDEQHLAATARNSENHDYPHRGGSNESDVSVSGSKGDTYREKQVKPNKVYVGSLPEHTRQEDLQSCFGKIGHILNIELKVGYGFVEFDTREAAEESVAKYHEGYFMGNKIRVELSHGGGRTAKYSGDPGACFKCGQLGHWARECPNQPGMNGGSSYRRTQYSDAPLIDRIQSSGHPLPPPRDLPYREDFASGRYALPPPPRDSRDSRHAYDYPMPPSGREPPRRPLTPPRDYRDYPAPPPLPRSRDYDDYRRAPPVLADRYTSRLSPEPRGRYAPDPSSYRYGPPPPLPDALPRDSYDRYDRRPSDRYAPYPPPGARPRSPVPYGRPRDEFERVAPPRDYLPPTEFRGRPITPPPPRYVERRRSESPPQVRAPPAAAPFDAPYSGFAGNGYSGVSPVAGPPRSGGLRDYTRGREELGGGGYRRN